MKKIISLVLFAVLVMMIVDGVLVLDFVYKSVVKVFLFLLIPLVFGNKKALLSLFKIERKKLVISVLLGIFVYVLIMGSYLALHSFVDLESIRKSLEEGIGVRRDNFIYVALYISLFNSLLEEFFFRGFAFLYLRKFAPSLAMGFSAVSFSIYHVGMMITWFNIWLFLLLLIGLVVAGILFNWLNLKSNSLLTSWIVHMFANFAINTVGLMVFGII